MTVRILTGDCRQVLRTLAEESVHCCITSPPYWGLRDYGIPPTVWGGDLACEHVWGDDVTKIGGGKQPADKVRWQHDTEARPNGHQAAAAGAFCRCGAWRGAHGLEPTIDLYVKNAVEIFRAVHRVLRPDGTLWLNLGDSYSATGRQFEKRAKDASGVVRPAMTKICERCGEEFFGGLTRRFCSSYCGGSDNSKRADRPDGLKPKDLCGIPWRVAFALQADGWWLRSEIIWHKPNPMPESVTDRPTKSHEQIFLLTKSAKYFYDAEAIKEPLLESTAERGYTAAYMDGEETGKSLSAPHEVRAKANWRANPYVPAGRNKRSVWTVATAPFSQAHFATFPPELIEPCIKAGTSEKGCCAKCGAPWVRVTETERKARSKHDGGTVSPRRLALQTGGTNSSIFSSRLAQVTSTLGWSPTCKCGSWVADKEWNSEPTVPCTVLDPFGGAGTTGLVADRLQRNAILIELNPTYAAMAHRRLSADAPLFAQVEAAE